MQAANSPISLREQLATQPPLMWFSLAFMGGIVLGKFVSLSIWVWAGLAFAFIVAAWLSYCGVYLLPSLLLTKLVAYLAHWKRPPQHQARTLVVYAVAIVGTGLTSLFFYANARLHELYGIFVNGFVINLVVTPGGLQSLGGSDATHVSFALIALAFLLYPAALLALIHFIYRKRMERASTPPISSRARASVSSARRGRSTSSTRSR